MNSEQFTLAQAEMKRHEAIIKKLLKLEYGLSLIISKEKHGVSASNVSRELPEECDYLLTLTTSLIEKWRTTENNLHEETLKMI